MRSLLDRVRRAVLTKRAVRLPDPADAAFVGGCSLIAVGVGMILLPAGVIAGGALLAWIGWRAGA